MIVRKSNIGLVITFTATVAVALASSGCKGRQARAELINFMNVIEGTRIEANSIIDDWANIEFEKAEDAGALEKKLMDLVQRIDTITLPVKNLKIESKEISDLRDLYIKTWESFRSPLELVAKVIRTRDATLAMTMQEQIEAKVKEYEKYSKEFEAQYSQLRDKYGITSEDLTITPMVSPIKPIPFSPTPGQ